MNFAFASSHDDIDLSGKWSITSENGEFAADYAVPGDVHSSLLQAGLIPDPYHGRNELDVRWVAEQTWTARKSFMVTGAAGSEWYLDIDYLDTVASVHLNGELVLHAENCFRRYRPGVTALVREGENTISITFHSNTAAADAKQEAQPFFIPYHAGNCPLPNGNMLRKPACHFGWDWNLAIAPFGLYGKALLRRQRTMRIEHVQVKQTHHAGGRVLVDVDVTLRGRKDADVTVTFDGAEKSRLIKGDYGDVKQRFRFEVEKPELWWPAGWGGQKLYDLSIECDGRVERRRVGLRTVELITDKDEAGSRFAFKVNGRELFCRGANWIPADALPSRATPELTRKLLTAARDANMNMIRVWGGGYYEQDHFYDSCDELGLLVWQDFMFSCHLYPSTPEFLREVKAEVDYQVRRLQHHSCLVLWCGDNELIGALTWFKESRENRDRYLVNYDRLNRLIEETMRGADPGGVWWPSSPSPGALSFGDAWHDDTSGDMHFWSVWHEGKSFSHYLEVKPRFCSEFGFQSFPSMRVARDFIASADDLNIASPVMEHHQRNAGGNARIAETMFRYFRFPKDFASFVYLSQIQHGLAMRTAIEAWRSLKPHCMGTLYWQLNDTWPVASWSGLDHGGDWKAMHYMARRFYAPVVVAVRVEPNTGEMVFSGINDLKDDAEIACDISFIAADGETCPVFSPQATVTARGAVEMARIKAEDVRKDGVYHYRWQVGGVDAGSNHVAAVPYKALDIPNSKLAVKRDVSGGSGGTVEISVTAGAQAFYVMIEAPVAGAFSDNVFDLAAGETRKIVFTPDDAEQCDVAAAGIAVRDLYSATY